MKTNSDALSSQARSEPGVRMTLWGIGVNIFLAVVKVATGVLGHSYALIADGIESTVDILSSTIVLGGLKIGALPPDRNHPFGHGKAESLAAMIVSFALLGAAVVIAVQSIQEIIAPHYLPAWYTLIVLAGVIFIKEILFYYEIRVGQSIHSLSVKVDAWHHRCDALTSLAVFIGISVALIGGPGFESADDWTALLVSFFIAFNGLRLLRFAVAEIMDSAPSPEIERQIRGVANSVEGVKRIEKCRVRKSGINFLAEIHVQVDGRISVDKGHEISHRVKDVLLASGLGLIDVVAHIEPA